jgi:uncharacterized protein YbaP (TraB family)
MIRAIHQFTLFACLVPTGAFAQNTILWEVTNPQNSHRSYLLGTMHQMGNSFVDSLPQLKEALLKSEVAYFESVDERDSLRAMLNRREPNLEYREMLKKEDVDYLDSISRDWKVTVSKLRPVELLIKLRQDYILLACKTTKHGDTWTHFDDYLIHLAKENNIPALGLETDSLQMVAIQDASGDVTWKDARKTVSKALAELRKAGPDGKPCTLARQYMRFEFNYKFNERCGDVLLSGRNDKWMPVILQSVETTNTFIAVGLLHLYGECGLITQLRSKGYIVKPIDLKGKDQ